MASSYIDRVLNELKTKHGHETEFIQAVSDFFEAVAPVIEAHPELEKDAVLQRMCEPERTIIFRVPWADDQGQVHVNTGYRVQFSSANGPYKGGIRFHPSVNLSILKFLGFEQVFKNILTGLPLGGAKGGSDFDPKGKSEHEIMRFCQSFVTELSRYIGPDLDVPAGDIGVGAREIGYFYGQYKRLNQPVPGVLTGKPVISGGSLGRTEATGSGLVYFLNHMLAAAGEELAGKRVIISGSGNVAYYAARKVQSYGGIVVSMSDSNSAIYDPNGIDLDLVQALKVDSAERIAKYAETYPGTNHDGSLWNIDIPADIALPCATQGEINAEQAQRLVDNGVKFLAEGANMPTYTEGVRVLKANGVAYAPGKAANAGGVAVSGLEMTQNSMRIKWTAERVDEELQGIMKSIFDNCVSAAEEYGLGNDYAAGADIASANILIDLMLRQGVV